MYICKDCKKHFSQLKEISERHNLDNPPFEQLAVCPNCGSSAIEEERPHYCRCCGARLKSGVYGYCNNACRKKGERMWIRQEQNKTVIEKGALSRLVCGVKRYNAENGTNYSYGQFVAVVLPGLSKSEAKKYI